MGLRKTLKAVVGTAVFWGAAWSLLSIPHVVSMLSTALPAETSPTHVVLSWAWDAWLFAFKRGALLGFIFALLLMLASRHSAFFRRLSYSGVGALGAVAAGGLGAVIAPGMGVFNLLYGAGLGATAAMASLAIARRAPDAPSARCSSGSATGLATGEIGELQQAH